MSEQKLRWLVLKPGKERPGMGWRYAGLSPHGHEVFHNLPGRTPGPSRVHQLAKMPTIDLRGLFHQMLAGKSLGEDVADAVALWDRDRLITAIRNLEDPYGTAMRPAGDTQPQGFAQALGRIREGHRHG